MRIFALELNNDIKEIEERLCGLGTCHDTYSFSFLYVC